MQVCVYVQCLLIFFFLLLFILVTLDYSCDYWSYFHNDIAIIQLASIAQMFHLFIKKKNVFTLFAGQVVGSVNDHSILRCSCGMFL